MLMRRIGILRRLVAMASTPLEQVPSSFPCTSPSQGHNSATFHVCHIGILHEELHTILPVSVYLVK